MSENTTHLLSVKDLHTSFTTDHGEVQAVNGVSFNLDAGKVLGIVGESGSGKSVTAYSIMQILADNGRITSGEILYKGEDISRWGESKMQDFRGKCCSIIFQDPMTSLNPVFTIGSQIAEAVLLHTKSSKHEAMEKALEMLKLVGINEPEKHTFLRYCGTLWSNAPIAVGSVSAETLQPIEVILASFNMSKSFTGIAKYCFGIIYIAARHLSGI